VDLVLSDSQRERLLLEEEHYVTCRLITAQRRDREPS
jgi:hypothetical protein